VASLLLQPLRNVSSAPASVVVDRRTNAVLARIARLAPTAEHASGGRSPTPAPIGVSPRPSLKRAYNRQRLL
jgi:hypothetical protein